MPGAATSRTLLALLAAIVAAWAAGCGGPVDRTPAGGAAHELDDDVAAFVGRTCVPCHRAGGAAPFALDTGGALARRGRTVTNVLRSGFMPPWLPADGDLELAGDRRPTPAVVEELVAWLADSPPLEDTSPIPAPPRTEVRADLTIAPESPLSLDRSNGPSLVRFAAVVPEGTAGTIEGVALRDPDGRFGHALVRVVPAVGAAVPPIHVSPASGPWLAPVGAARRVESGDRVEVRLFARPATRPSTATPAIEIALSDEPAAVGPIALRLAADDLALPARAAAVAATATARLDRDAIPVEILPDAHLYCRTISVRATRPDGTTLVLLDIPKWDLAWQESYRPIDAPALPAGTVVEATWTWDNSRANPRNPHDPLVDVAAGPVLADARGVVWLTLRPRLY